MNPSALSNKNFRIYLGGALSVLIGLWVYRVTLGWLAWELTGSELAVGLVAFCQFAPGIVLGPLFGVLADRLNLVRAASSMQAGVLVLAVALCLASATGMMSFGLLLLFSLLQGLLQSAYTPVRLALVSRLVPPPQLASAIGFIAVAFNLSRFLGPALAGVIIAWLGASWSFGIFAAMIFPAILILQIVQVAPEQHKRAERAALLVEFRDGLRYALAHQLIRWLFVLVGINGLLARGLLELLPAITELMYNQGSGAFAALTSAAGVGAIAASLYISTTSSHTQGLMRAAILASLLSAGLVFALAMVRLYWLGLLLVAVMGFACTLCSVSTQTLIQLNVDGRFRGRIMGLWGVFAMGASALGALMLGGLSHWIELSAAMLLAASALLVLSLWLGLLLRAPVMLRAAAKQDPEPSLDAERQQTER